MDDRSRPVALVRPIFTVIVLIVFGMCNLQTCTSVNVGYVQYGRGSKPEECWNNINQQIGVCYTAKSTCTNNGGEAVSGMCFKNFKTCCSFHYYECIVEVNEKHVYINNPGYPKLLEKFHMNINRSAICEVKLIKKPFDSHQIRIDFIGFNLPIPSDQKHTICKKDRLLVTGGASSDLTVCGPFSRQHIYYRINDASDIIKIKLITSGTHFDRSWKIKITRLEPAAEAPDSCLQYYTNATGTLQTLDRSVNGRFLVQTDLNICIKRAQNVCSIKYESCGRSYNPFKIIQPLSRSLILPYIRLDEDITQIGGFRCIRYQQQTC